MATKNDTNVTSVFNRIYREAKARKTLLLVLSCFVVFITSYMLILPAVTLDQEEAERQGGIDVTTEQQTDVITEDSEVSEESIVSEDAAPASVPATGTTDAQPIVSELTAEGKDFQITVTYGDNAKIPNGSELVAKEIPEGTK